ncbi:MAG TPA: hypothetical protein DCP92_19100 [Nitrospiraceae bacterium]|nr:hypothetical protein [Nitrospiraceae bacterium]
MLSYDSSLISYHSPSSCGAIIGSTTTIDGKGPACNMTVVTTNRNADIGVALLNSLGFAGVNAVSVLRRTEQ